MLRDGFQVKIWDPRAPGCQGAHSQPDKVLTHLCCAESDTDITVQYVHQVYSLGVAGEKLVVATAGRKVF